MPLLVTAACKVSLRWVLSLAVLHLNIAMKASLQCICRKLVRLVTSLQMATCLPSKAMCALDGASLIECKQHPNLCDYSTSTLSCLVLAKLCPRLS